jgi:hypothetical protein
MIFASTDLENTYHVLLGRAPENSAILNENARSGADIAREFVNSDEFDREVAQQIIEGQLGTGPRYAGKPELSLRLWIGEFFPVSPRTRQILAEVRHWPQVLETLFSDADFEKSANVKGRAWNLRELGARLGGARSAWLIPQLRKSY